MSNVALCNIVYHFFHGEDMDKMQALSFLLILILNIISFQSWDKIKCKLIMFDTQTCECNILQVEISSFTGFDLLASDYFRKLGRNCEFQNIHSPNPQMLSITKVNSNFFQKDSDYAKHKHIDSYRRGDKTSSETYVEALVPI